jgi:CDGSH-type Zn-finger protein
LGERRVVALCRCGASNNKPFCDGSHGPSGFRSEIEARDLAGPKPASS